jgi:hypothetical protein
MKLSLEEMAALAMLLENPDQVILTKNGQMAYILTHDEILVSVEVPEGKNYFSMSEDERVDHIGGAVNDLRARQTFEKYYGRN